MNLGSQRIIKMDCVVREPLHCLAAQARETAIFEGEPGGALRISSNQPSLPAKRGFVVQLHADAHVEQGQGKGRVEHLVSRESEHFASLEELTAFIVQVLTHQ